MTWAWRTWSLGPAELGESFLLADARGFCRGRDCVLRRARYQRSPHALPAGVAGPGPPRTGRLGGDRGLALSVLQRQGACFLAA